MHFHYQVKTDSALVKIQSYRVIDVQGSLIVFHVTFCVTLVFYMFPDVDTEPELEIDESDRVAEAKLEELQEDLDLR